jgi:hypothetical protein
MHCVTCLPFLSLVARFEFTNPNFYTREWDPVGPGVPVGSGRDQESQAGSENVSRLRVFRWARKLFSGLYRHSQYRVQT